MGVSFAISAGIVMTAILYIILLIPGFVDNTILQSEASREASELEKKNADTSIDILSTTMAAGSDNFTFELVSEGSEKIWKYDKFTILVTYNGDLTGSLTESLTYQGVCSGVPLTGKWCKNSMQNDLLDPDILNEDETMEIWLRLEENIDTGVGIITISTDTGAIASYAVLA